MSKPLLVCFGEVLWDSFPDERRLGGAPLNVAYRLHALGNQVVMLSALGNDALGDKTFNSMKALGLSTQGIQRTNDFSTGTVLVQLYESGSATYTIEQPVAWDHIQSSETAFELARNAAYFIYGSLAGRNKTTFATLNALLGVTGFKIFDVNLRPPHYNKEHVLALMQEANAIKINDQEIDLICEWLQIANHGLKTKLFQIAQLTSTPFVCVTLGADGAAAMHKQEFAQVSGYKVKVEDTVGAGDSFLGMLIEAYFVRKNTLQTALSNACAMGALVASKKGATAAVTQEELQALKNSKK